MHLIFKFVNIFILYKFVDNSHYNKENSSDKYFSIKGCKYVLWFSFIINMVLWLLIILLPFLDKITDDEFKSCCVIQGHSPAIVNMFYAKIDM